MLQSKHIKENPYLLVLISSWIFCSFLKFHKNVESSLTILCNCLQERCLLHTSFKRLETGWTTNIYLSFSFVAASRKKSFHIFVKSHDAELKLQSLPVCWTIQCIARCKIFCQSFMFHYFTINCIWLMFFLHELKHVLALVKQFISASIETFLSSRYYSHGSSFSY